MKLRTPNRVAENDNRRSPRALIRIIEVAAERGMNPQCPKEVMRNGSAFDLDGFLLAYANYFAVTVESRWHESYGFKCRNAQL